MRSHEATSWERKAIALRMAAEDARDWGISSTGSRRAASSLQLPAFGARGQLSQCRQLGPVRWASGPRRRPGCLWKSKRPGTARSGRVLRRGGAGARRVSVQATPTRPLGSYRAWLVRGRASTRGSAFPITAHQKSRALGRRPLDSSGLDSAGGGGPHWEMSRTRRVAPGPASALYEHPAQALHILQRLARRGVLLQTRLKMRLSAAWRMRSCSPLPACSAPSRPEYGLLADTPVRVQESFLG